MAFDKITFVASGAPAAQASVKALRERYDGVDPEFADVVVALGGDGFMLETLHRFIGRGVPIYGMNRGTVGFLMNEYIEDDLAGRLAQASKSIVHPLVMTTRSVDGSTAEALAINEVSLLRQTRQASKIRISV
ncbi:MAG: NAD(+)/NADH kinase, partial [Alphaproteobacteria bacterium]